MGQRVIIVEGPDQCGKTQISKELARRLQVPYFKNSDEHKYFLSDPGYFINAVRYVDTYFTSYLEASGASVVLDRAWPSEWVYSQVLGRNTDMSVLRELDRRHSQLGTVIVIPTRSSYAGIRDDYDAVSKNLQRIHDVYLKFAAWTTCRVLELNVDDENLEREISVIMEGLNV